MDRVSGYGSFRVKSENGFHDNIWSDEQDCIPLKQRLKMLLASKRLSGLTRVEAEKTSESPSISQSDVCVKKEDQQFNLQEERNQMFSPEQSHLGMHRDYSWQGTEGNEYVSSNGIKPTEVNGGTDLVEKVDSCSSTLTPCSLLSKYAIKSEVDYADHNLAHLFGNGLEGALCTEVRAVKMDKEIAYDFVDDLDHVVLKERLRLLLSRKLRKSTKPVMEGNCSSLSAPVVGDTIQHSTSRGKKDNYCGDAKSLVAGNHNSHVPAKNDSGFDTTLKSGTSFSSMRFFQRAKSAKPRVTVIQENNRICSSEKVSTTKESFGGHDSVSGSPYSMPGLPLSPTFVNIKAEPWDHGDVHQGKKDAACSYPSSRVVPVKIEFEILEASYQDKIDHMLLQDRIKLMASREPLNLVSSRNFGCSKKAAPSVVDCHSIASEVDKPIRINRPRKKRKTSTDSVEIALEEDAPGLLQVLIDKGVLVNEIKLYGEPESDEALDDSFSELEAVIQNLFSRRQSLLKLPPLRCAKVEKASYCMACLISLVEQARYLQFRKWPVEWGWCRDLQSFIFVFERHNRIVLERPEYGFATYFFELVDTLPIHWQIKRLVTAMKLSSCSRVSLIENKTLMVGDDLTEGEARVLTEYGWIPNSGLGTMLNYCDRVVHDKKNERESLDWRSKIGQFLMNGYNGGTIVLTDIPKKVPGYSGAQGPEIKLEI